MHIVRYLFMVTGYAMAITIRVRYRRGALTGNAIGMSVYMR